MPILDVPTRWHSCVDMLIRLENLKDFCNGLSDAYPELKLSEEDWESINQLIMALEPAKKATKVFQSEQLTMGDFLAEWINWKGKTSKIGTRFSKKLVTCMENREKNLFQNDAFCAAILLDPR